MLNLQEFSLAKFDCIQYTELQIVSGWQLDAYLPTCPHRVRQHF